MATSSGYDGGIGGKFRRRTLRRSAATPYDRPASAARGGAPRGLVSDAGGGNGWLSKIVDPASRFIAGSASRFFASVFRKRLTAPPAEPEGTRGTNGLIIKEDTQVVSVKPLPEVESKTTDLASLPSSSGTDAISDFEQILMQKTLTRDEFERLTTILRSRIVNSDSSDPTARNENIDNSNVPLQSNALEGTHEEPSKPLIKLAIPGDEAASPAQLAKAYMGSRTSKLPPSALSLWTHALPEENKMASMLGEKPLFSVGQRSVIRAPPAAERPQDGYSTPRPLGRSAIFKMSRSPYFRPNATSSVKGRGYSKDGSSSSFHTPKSITHYGGRELLKRGSTVLDSDIGSFGPIRRTRHKFNQISPSKGMPPVPAGKLHLTYNSDINGGFTAVQKSPQPAEQNYDVTNMQSSDMEFGRAELVQSSKIAMKISQELDKFMPSPKEKSSDVVSIGESNMKLSRPITHSQSIRKLKNLDTSEFRIFGSLGSSATPILKNPLAQKQIEARQNGSSISAGSGINLIHENFKHSGMISSTDLETSKSTVEGSSKANYHDPILRETSAAPHTSQERVGVKTSLGKWVGPETAAQDHDPFQSSTSVFSTDIQVSKMGKGSTGTISRNGMDFSFPAAPVSNSFSVPPTPTLPSALVQNTTQKDPLAAPLLTFGSKDIHDVAVSSTKATDNVTEPNEDAIKSSAKSTAQSLIIDDVGEAKKSRVVFKSFGNVDSTDKSESSTPLFAFGVKTDESSSNGSLYSSSLSFSVAGAIPLSANNAMSSSNSTDSSASVSVTFPIFKFGSDTPSQLDKSNISQLDPAKASTYSNNTMLTAAQLSNENSCSILATSATVLNMENSYIAQVKSTVSKSSTLVGSTESSSTTTSVADCSTKISPAIFTAPTASVFGTKKTFESEASHLFKSPSSQFGSFSSSPSFGLQRSSSSGFGGFQFGAATADSKPFSSSSTFSSSAGAGSSNSTTSFSPSVFGGFQFGAATADSKPFSSNSASSSSAGAGSSNSTTSSSFAPQSFSSTGVSFASPGNTNVNASSFQHSTFSLSSTFPHNAPSSSTTLSFLASTSASSSSPFVSSPASPFPFTSASAISADQWALGRTSSASPGNGQMNMEDSMVVETQVPTSVSPASGVPGSLPTTPVFGTSEVQPAAPVFQFGGNQNPFSSNSSPFQAAAGSAGFSAGGSFSLGSGGGDKSGRRIIKVKRDRPRKK